MQRHFAPIALAVLGFASAASCSRSATEPLTTVAATSSTYVTVVMPDKLSLAVGDTTQLRPIAILKDGTFQTITTTGAWTSSAGNVASVDESGIVRALAAGPAEIALMLDG